jgi:hypothetical protein
MGDMTGDAPQPGETPRDDGTPWSHADPASPWWRADEQDPAADRPRSPRRRASPAAAAAQTLDPPQPAQHTGVAAEAHQAGAQDVRAALTGEPPRSEKAVEEKPAAGEPAAPRHAQQKQAPAPEGKATEHDHDRVDAERFNTQGEGAVYAARNHAETAAAPPDTVAAEPPRTAETPPDVMILPEPDRNRTTVALDRNAVPGQSSSGLSRQSRAGQDQARADRNLQDRVRHERAAALLETSSFWKPEAAGTPETPTGVAPRPRRRAPQPRRPAAGLFGLLALGLVATFFAWVSAEPFWLAVGHGDRGSATVARCTGSGVSQRCIGQFIAANGAYRVDELALFGVEPAQRAPGASAPARMVSSQSRQAYLGSTGVLVHLRWALSFVLVLLCGLGIAGLTGARRLDTPRYRRGALLVSMAGPLVLLAGFLYLTY